MANYTEELAQLEWLKAKNDQRMAFSEAQLALAEMKMTQARLERHVLKVDFDGYVVKLIKKPQEHVNIGDEVMQLARDGSTLGYRNGRRHCPERTRNRRSTRDGYGPTGSR